MSKYRRLKDFLYKCKEDIIELSFREIESILRFELPGSAYLYRAWWANSSHNALRVWIDIGWRVATVDFKTQSVEFERKKILDYDSANEIVDPEKALDIIQKMHELAQLNIIDIKTFQSKRQILLDKIE